MVLSLIPSWMPRSNLPLHSDGIYSTVRLSTVSSIIQFINCHLCNALTRSHPDHNLLVYVNPLGHRFFGHRLTNLEPHPVPSSTAWAWCPCSTRLSTSILLRSASVPIKVMIGSESALNAPICGYAQIVYLCFTDTWNGSQNLSRV